MAVERSDVALRLDADGSESARGLERVAIALMQFIGNVVSCSYYRPDLMSQIIGQSNGSSASVESPCRIRIDTSLCRCGVIAAQRLAGISSDVATR